MRPYVAINCAATVDGRISLDRGHQTRISCREDMVRVHKMRAQSDAILVGIGTILADDPALTVKPELVGGNYRNPLRVIVDSYGRTPTSAKAVNGDAPSIIAVASQEASAKKIGNAEIILAGTGRVNLNELLSELSRRGVKRLMVEGGSRIIWSFLSERLFDEFSVYIGSMVFGRGPAVADSGCVMLGGIVSDFADGSARNVVNLKLKSSEPLGNGVLLKYTQ